MRLAVFLMIGAFLLAGATLAHGQGSATSVNAAPAQSVAPRAAGGKKDAKPKLPIALTPEREAAALTFVQRNHAELADLLGYLKTSQPEAYERAIKEIFRTTERLNQIQDRDPLQYELEVAAWAAQSRVQLLAAKLKMEANDDLLKQLREALKSQVEAKLSLLQHERHKVADRLSKIDTDISRFASDREKYIDRQVQLLTRGAGEGRPAKAGAKAAAKAKKISAPPETKPASP